VAPADFVAAGTIRRIAGFGATVIDALQALERHGKSATNGLRRDITGVRKLVGDELRHLRENAPPLLNLVPFPI
jgi:hypothetical protein